MKADYLKRLRAQLEEFNASKTDIDDIISDYEQLYDDAKSRGKTDEEVYQFLGDPKQVAYDLIDTLKIKHKKDVRNKVVGIMPFVSLIIFMLLGFLYDMWNPGWMAFLLIPLAAIVLHTNFRNAMVAVMPFISVIAFLIMGFYFDLWNPGWMVFLLIPMVAIVLNTRPKDMLVALSPFVAVIVFVILGMYYDLWNPGWLVFLIIPMLGILHKRNLLQKYLLEISFLLAIGFYLYMGYAQDNWTIGGLGFLLPVVLLILFGDIVFDFTLPKGKNREKVIILLSTIALSILVFMGLGLFLNGWAYAWQVFLLIPVTSILLYDKFRFTTLSPFIAVILFFSIGYFFNAFQLSWLAFLIIPMAGVLENA